MNPNLDSLNLYSEPKAQQKTKRDYAGTGAIIFTFTVLSIVIDLSIYTAWQVVYGQEEQPRSFEECYSSVLKQIQYVSMPTMLSPSKDDMNPKMKTFITNACNFYHEKTGKWLSLGDCPDPQLAEEFYLKYKDTYPQSIKELIYYIITHQYTDPVGAGSSSDCGLISFASCTNMGSLRQEYDTKWNEYMEESKTCDSKTGPPYAQCLNDLMNKHGLFDKKYD